MSKPLIVGVLGFKAQTSQAIKQNISSENNIHFLSTGKLDEAFLAYIDVLIANAEKISVEESSRLSEKIVAGDVNFISLDNNFNVGVYSQLLELDEENFYNKDIMKFLNISLQIYQKQNELKELNENVRIGQMAQAAKGSFEILETLVNFIGQKDHYTKGHCKRVAQYAYSLGDNMGLAELEKERIFQAGLIHDVGKIGLPDDLLTKKGCLHENEYEQIKSHSQLGNDLIPKFFLAKLKPAILQHHERWDGTGYPNGLEGEEISLEARVLAAADAYDAMTTQRSYCEIKTEKEALEEIERCSGSQFDPEVAENFVNLMQEKNKVKCKK